MEAALLFPIIIIVLLSFVYYSFYLHDHLVMKAESYGFALDLKNYRGQSEEELSLHIRKILEEKTIIVKNTSALVEMKNSGMKIDYKGEFQIPFLAINVYLKNGISSVCRTSEARSILKSEFIRMSEAGKDALNLD